MQPVSQKGFHNQTIICQANSFVIMLRIREQHKAILNVLPSQVSTKSCRSKSNVVRYRRGTTARWQHCKPGPYR